MYYRWPANSPPENSPRKVPPRLFPPGKFHPNEAWLCEICRWREPVETRVLNPNANEASYKPKQRSYKKMKVHIFFFHGDFGRGDFIRELVYTYIYIRYKIIQFFWIWPSSLPKFGVHVQGKIIGILQIGIIPKNICIDTIWISYICFLNFGDPVHG